MILVFASVKSAVKFAAGIDTWKSLALRFARSFRLMVLVVVVVLVPVFVLLLLLLLLFVVVTCGLRATEIEVGGWTPRVRALSRRTCMTAISTTTSGFALSMSPRSFSAIAIWSGVPRTTIAF